MALTTEELKRLKEAIVVKPTGKFFVFGKDSYPFTNDPIELEKILRAVDKPKTTYVAGARLFPLLYVGNPGTGKTYQAKELADTSTTSLLVLFSISEYAFVAISNCAG